MDEDAFSTNFPALPHNPAGWSTNIHNAHTILDNAFSHGLDILRQDDSDPLRCRVVSENLVNQMVPILESLEGDGVPQDFVHTCIQVLGPLVYELEVAALSAEGV